MLIIFESPAPDLARENPEELEAFLSELIRSSIRGLHFVVVGRETCTWALGNLNLSGRERAHLESLKQNYTQYGSLKDVALCLLNIGIGDNPVSEQNAHHYIAGYKTILQGNYLLESSFLVENIENDGQFYELVMNETKFGQPVKNLCIGFKNGGGSVIVPSFRQEVSDDRIVVCLSDSDQHSPHENNQIIFRQLCRAAERQVFIGMIAKTVGRSIENHIPLSIIEDQNLCPNYTDFQMLQDLLEAQVVESKGDCLWLHFNLRDGMDGGSLIEKNLAQDTLDWVSNKFVNEDTDFADLNISGFGNRLLSQFLNSWSAAESFHAFVRTDYWETHFKECFEQIYWYFIASKKTAID